MALMPVVIVPVLIVDPVVSTEIDLLVIVDRAVSTVTARPEIALLVGTSEIVPVLIVDPVVSTEIDLLVIVDRAVNMAIVPAVIVVQALIVDPVVSTETDLLVIVDRAVNMAIVRCVVMIRAVILVVVIVIAHPAETMEIDPAVIVIVRPAVISVIVTALHVVTIQGLTHVVAIVIVLLVAMVQAQVAHRARVVMTAVMAVVAVDRVAKTSHLAVQRTKLNVVAKPCAHAVAAKSAKTASRHRCHARQRPGLMKAELKTKYAMQPKVLCVVGLHRDALCRRDQKMKTN
jgi:hypothetical protein